MNLKKSLFLSMLTLGLAACGSGGGGSPTVSVTSTNKPKEVKPVELGGFATFVNADLTSKSQMITGPGNINTLVVDGKSIELVPENFITPVLHLSSQSEDRVIGNNLKYARYGFYETKNNGKLLDSYVFYQGQITPEKSVPSKGAATYKGIAIYDSLKVHKAKGEAEFNVNFQQGTINGVISSENKLFDPVNLSGTITGNRFSTGNVDDVNTTMSGAFYGPRAEEISGRFDILNKVVSGTFGASKQ